MQEITTEIISRVFNLKPIENSLDFDYSIFEKYRHAVNIMISEGVNYSDSLFENDGLIAVKNFYNLLTKNPITKSDLISLGVLERLIRCAAQYAFFSIKNAKQVRNLVEVLAEVLLNDMSWVKIPQKEWDYWNLETFKKIPRRFGLSNNYIEKIRKRHHNDYPTESGILNRTLINNYYRHLKKILSHNMTLNLDFFKNDNQELLNEIFLKYNHEFLDNLIWKFSTQVSSILTRNFNKIKRLNKNQEITNKKIKNNQLSRLIFKICEPTQLKMVDSELWRLCKSEWIGKYNKVITDSINLKDVQKEIKLGLERLRDKPEEYLARVSLYSETVNLRYKISNEPYKDFISFLKGTIDYHLSRLVIKQNQILIETKIKDLLQNINLYPTKYLKTPIFKKSSIPLGLDDGNIYTIREHNSSVEISLSFYPRRKYTFLISNPERYFSLIKDEWIPLKGVLFYPGGKLQLALPFKKRLPVKTKQKLVEDQLMLNCDLGLKTFVSLSVTKCGIEKDRRFLDQRELMGLKNLWFLPKVNNGVDTKTDARRFINYKRKLVSLQKQCYEIQSHIEEIKRKNQNKRKNNPNFPKYTHTKEYWYKKRLFKQNWRKINNIHRELIHQISSRIVEYAKFKDVDNIRFENLKWSRLSSKRDVGNFLATWQVHWFFSQIIIFTARIARRYGIFTNIVNPYKSSKLCSNCGQEGIRSGKRFICKNSACNFKLDSDLNAARNLGDLSRQIYPLRL